ncbi:MAG: hypothetical protein WKF73_08680 [Nocardioidaceae bacterium]
MTPHGAPVEATSNRPYRTRPPLGPLGAAACVVALASALMAGPAAALLTPDASATQRGKTNAAKGAPERPAVDRLGEPGAAPVLELLVHRAQWYVL